MWLDLPSLLWGRAPRQVVVQITSRCNASCPQCSMRAGATVARSTMPNATALSVIERAADANVRAISFTGGEPLLDVDQVARFVRFARLRGIQYTRTGTNGFLFANPDLWRVAERARSVADKLSNAGLRNLWISLDSADPTTHEALRGLPGRGRRHRAAAPRSFTSSAFTLRSTSGSRAPGRPRSARAGRQGPRPTPQRPAPACAASSRAPWTSVSRWPMSATP